MTSSYVSDKDAADIMAAEAPTRAEEKADEIRMDFADEERYAALELEDDPGYWT